MAKFALLSRRNTKKLLKILQKSVWTMSLKDKKITNLFLKPDVVVQSFVFLQECVTEYRYLASKMFQAVV